MTDIVLVAIVTGSVSIITSIINRLGNKKFLDRIAEGLRIGLENDKVIFNAFRRNKINGESEKQECKMNAYFMENTTNSFFRRNK